MTLSLFHSVILAKDTNNPRLIQMIVIIWRTVSHSSFLHTGCHFSFCNGHIHFLKGRFQRDRPTSMVTMSQMQTLLQTACNVTDSVPLTCQQVGWFIDRRGKPVGGLRWRRRVPPSLLSCRPAGCLQTTAILLPPTHPPPPEELGLLGMAMLSTHWLSSSYPLHTPTSLQELQGWSCCQ